MSSAGHELLAALRAAAMELLGGLAVPDVTNLLDELDALPPPAWQGTALDGQLIGRITPGVLAGRISQPGARAAVQRLDATVGSSDSIGLFGRLSAGRRVPVLAAQAGTGADRLLVLVGPRADGQPGFEAVIAGSAAPVSV